MKIYCSKKCGSEYNSKKKIDKICKYCDTPYIGGIQSKYCSKKCRKKGQAHKHFISGFKSALKNVKEEEIVKNRHVYGFYTGVRHDIKFLKTI